MKNAYIQYMRKNDKGEFCDCCGTDSIAELDGRWGEARIHRTARAIGKMKSRDVTHYQVRQGEFKAGEVHTNVSSIRPIERFA